MSKRGRGTPFKAGSKMCNLVSRASESEGTTRFEERRLGTTNALIEHGLARGLIRARGGRLYSTLLARYTLGRLGIRK